MFAAAGVLLVFSLTFGLIALAEGLVALHLWRWAAYLIVFGFLVLLAGAAGADRHPQGEAGQGAASRPSTPPRPRSTALRKATSHQPSHRAWLTRAAEPNRAR